MRIKAFLLAMIMCACIIIPIPVAQASEFMSVTPVGNNKLAISGYSENASMVTLRSLYFGEVKPDENYEISNNDYDGIHHIEIKEVVKNSYMFELEVNEAGYYLISVTDNNGRKETTTYNKEKETSEFTDSKHIFKIRNESYIVLAQDSNYTTLMPVKDYGIYNGDDIDAHIKNYSEWIQQDIKNYVTDVTLPDEAFFEEYGTLVGMKDNVGIFKNDIIRILSNNVDNRDFTQYEVCDVFEKDNSLIAENLRLSDLTLIENQIKRETLIEFTAPKADNYNVAVGLAGEGCAKFELTALNGKRQFDNLSLINREYRGNSDDFSQEISLNAGEKIYLHIYPVTGSISLNFSVTGENDTYSLECVEQSDNKLWMEECNENGRFAYDLNDGTENRIVNVSRYSKLYFRPVIKLNNEFFTSVQINTLTVGENVRKLIQSNFKRSDFSELYSKIDIDILFDEQLKLLYEVVSLKDENGQDVSDIKKGTITATAKVINPMPKSKEFMLAVALYDESGRVLKITKEDFEISKNNEEEYSISISIDNDYIGAYAKVYLWNTVESMSPVREKISDNLSTSNSGKTGNWRIYEKPSGSVNYAEFSEQSLSGTNTVVSNNSNLPYVYWNHNDSNNTAFIRPHKGVDEVIEFTVPYDGNWKIDLTYKNIGTDVLGGDGGRLTLSYLPKNESILRNFAAKKVHISTENPTTSHYITTVYANAGDKIILSAYAEIAGYGDKWEINYSIFETKDKGIVIDDKFSDILPITSSGKKASSADTEVPVWIGINGFFADSEVMKEKVSYLKRYIPEFGLILSMNNPRGFENAEYFEANNIPVIMQSYGTGFENYVDGFRGFEWDWDNLELNDIRYSHFLSGTAHAFALPHYATKEVFSRMAKSSAKNGFSGFGYPDFVWMYGHRGRTGYNPETIKAFREDLLKLDEGLLCDDGLWNFHDYYRYYTGANEELMPEDFGFASWDEYEPLSKSDYESAENAGVDTTHHWSLLDFLCHYEWLKFAQYIGRVSDDNDAVSQILVNAEYFANGVDYKFLNKLISVDMTEDEYFGNTDYLDGAYYRQKYMTENSKNMNTGGVMEAGDGGNAGAYYSDEIAYLAAFELGALSYIKHLEADYLYQGETYNKERDSQILSFAAGFSDAKSLNLDKRTADFTVISGRNHIRPWNGRIWAEAGDWYPWDLRLSFEENREFYLSKMGYNFESVSQEALKDIEREEVAVFSPTVITDNMWKLFYDKVKSGFIKNGIVSAERFKTCVTEKLKLENFNELYPQMSYQSESVELNGIVTNNGKIVNDKAITYKGELYSVNSADIPILYLDEKPVLAKRQVGEGNLYILLFDDGLMENYDLSEIVYDYILKQNGISPMYRSLINSGSVTTDYTITKEQQNSIDGDLGASVRVYENKEELTVVGIQNSLGRIQINADTTSTGISIPYEIEGETKVKILMEKDKSYKYIAIPSMEEGRAEVDEDGYINIGFTNKSHQIFFILPENSQKDFSDILLMQNLWKEALKF